MTSRARSGGFPSALRGQRRHFEDIAAGPAIENAALELFRQRATLPELAALARHGNRAVLELFEIAGEAIGLVHVDVRQHFQSRN